MRLVLFRFLLLSLILPVTPSHAAAEGGLAADHAGAALHAQVQRLIGRAACRSDAQCRTLPLGERACGGPQAYVAWSVRRTNQAALERAAQRYTLWHAQAQQLKGAQGICMVEVDPGATCLRPAAPARDPSATGRCVLDTQAAGAENR